MRAEPSLRCPQNDSLMIRQTARHARTDIRRNNGSAGRGILALSGGRAKRLGSHAEGLPASARRISRPKTKRHGKNARPMISAIICLHLMKANRRVPIFACNFPRFGRSTDSWSPERNWRTIRCANCNCRSSRRNLPLVLTRQQIEELLAAPLKVERTAPRRSGCRCATLPSWSFFTAAACA